MATTNGIRVAIVGCGVIGKVHADLINAHPGVGLVAAVDTDPIAARDVADATLAAGHAEPVVAATLEEALSHVEIDLVVVCTPSGAHLTEATKGIEAGAHVLIEKPLDVDVSAGRAFAALAADVAARGRVVSVVSQHRFDPSSAVVRAAVESRELGKLTSAVAAISWWRSQEYYDSGDWRGTWALDGGGALMNQSVHTVDLMLWMMGRPVEVFGWTALLGHERIEVEDTCAAVVRFESGALATIHATTAAYPGPGNRLQIMGDKGSAVIDTDVLTFFHAGDPASTTTELMGRSFAEGNQVSDVVSAEDNVAVPMSVGHTRQYDDVIDAIRTGRAPSVTVEDALVALATVRAIYLSASLGHPVLIDDVRAGAYDGRATSLVDRI